jgi:transposase-like protein
MNFDWPAIRARFELGETPGAISRSLGGRPSRQAIHKKLKGQGWKVYEPVDDEGDSVDGAMALMESGQWGKCTQQNKARVIKVLRNGATYKIAAATIGVGDRTLRDWRDKDPVFAGLCEAAQAADMQETMAYLQKLGKTDPNIAKFRAQRHRLTRDEYGEQPAPYARIGTQFNILGRLDLGIDRGPVIDAEPENRIEDQR